MEGHCPLWIKPLRLLTFLEERLSQPAFSRKVFPLTWTNYDLTIDLFTEAFFNTLGIEEENLYEVETLELNVRLMLEKHAVSRRILVPANATLDILHLVIQKTFGWADTHLHQYLLLSKGATSLFDKTDINIYTANSLEDLEFFDEAKPFLIYATTTIKDVLELPYDLWYEHNLGDSWALRITLEATHRLLSRQYRLIEAIGDCPPDDVGGESGYEEFLKVMADKNHPEHEDYCGWYEIQTSHRLPPEKINLWLERGWVV